MQQQHPRDFPPVIDISQWARSEDGLRRVSEKWDEAFSKFGFAIIIGHDIPNESIDSLRSEAAEYFSLPVEEKMRDHWGPYGCPEGGYTPLQGEAVALSLASADKKDSRDVSLAQKDRVESFVVHCAPRDVPPVGSAAAVALAKSATDHARALLRLLSTLHVISCSALGLTDLGYFDRFFDSTHPAAAGCKDPSLSLRLAHYPPAADALDPADVKEGEVRLQYGAHTDYLTYTLLSPDSGDWGEGGAGGLQVLVGGDWLPVRLPEEARYGLVVNAGDLIQRWTNDRWKSPVHRVMCPTRGGAAANRSRLSVVFFTGPLMDAAISCIPGARPSGDSGRDVVDTDDRSRSLYDTVITADYLRQKINPTATTSSSTNI